MASAEARHLGQSARHDRGDGVCAERDPPGSPRGDRDHVLERPAQLDSNDVLGGVGAKRAARERPLPRAGGTGSMEATTDAAGKPFATSWARLGPESTAIDSARQPSCASTSLISSPRAVLDTFGR